MVIDYKSGLVSDDEGVKSAYVRQLLFYGALVDECLAGDPGDAGSAVPARGSGAGRAVRRGDGRGSGLARAARLEFNERVPEPSQPSRPRRTVSGVGTQLDASAFWQAVEPHWAVAVGDAVRGTVEADPEHATTGVTTLQVMVEHGPLAGSIAILAGIPTALVASAGVGSVVSVLDLRARSEDPLVLTWTHRATSLSRIVVS